MNASNLIGNSDLLLYTYALLFLQKDAKIGKFASHVECMALLGLTEQAERI